TDSTSSPRKSKSSSCSMSVSTSSGSSSMSSGPTTMSSGSWFKKSRKSAPANCSRLAPHDRGASGVNISGGPCDRGALCAGGGGGASAASWQKQQAAEKTATTNKALPIP